MTISNISTGHTTTKGPSDTAPGAGAKSTQNRLESAASTGGGVSVTSTGGGVSATSTGRAANSVASGMPVPRNVDPMRTQLSIYRKIMLLMREMNTAAASRTFSAMEAIEKEAAQVRATKNKAADAQESADKNSAIAEGVQGGVGAAAGVAGAGTVAKSFKQGKAASNAADGIELKRATSHADADVARTNLQAKQRELENLSPDELVDAQRFNNTPKRLVKAESERNAAVRENLDAFMEGNDAARVAAQQKISRLDGEIENLQSGMRRTPKKLQLEREMRDLSETEALRDRNVNRTLETLQNTHSKASFEADRMVKISMAVTQGGAAAGSIGSSIAKTEGAGDAKDAAYLNAQGDFEGAQQQIATMEHGWQDEQRRGWKEGLDQTLQAFGNAMSNDVQAKREMTNRI